MSTTTKELETAVALLRARAQRAEQQLEGLYALRDQLTALSDDPDTAWDLAVRYTEELSRQHDADCDVMKARAEEREALAAWLDQEAARNDVLRWMRNPGDVLREAAAAIRAEGAMAVP